MAEQPDSPRAAIYPRYSADMQSPSSIEDQERECRAFAERQGWRVTHVDSDAAVRAGAVAGREGYQRLLAAAQRKEFDILLVEEISRFSRDFLGGFADLAELKRLGVRVADTKKGLLDPDTFEGQIILALGLATSQQETKRLGERSKRGLKGKVLSGYSSGGQPAYGLKRAPIFSDTLLDPDGRPKRAGVRLEPDPIQAPIVRRIFQMYEDGLSKHEIARRLNKERIPSRDAGRVRVGQKNDGTWNHAAIGAILRNEIYIGIRIWNKHSRKGDKLPRSGKKRLVENPREQWERVENYCEAIIDLELWKRVQLRLQAEAKRYQARHTTGEDRRYPLSGLLKCANCGHSFVIGAHYGPKNKKVPHYRCGFRHTRGRTVCSNPITVPRPALEERVRNALDVVVKDPEKLAELVVEHNRRINQTNEAQLAVVRVLKAQQQKLREECENLVAAIAQTRGPMKLLVTEMEKREKQMEELTPRIEEARSLVQPLLHPRLPAVQEYVTGGASLFEEGAEGERSVLERILEGIVVYANGTISLRFRGDSLFAPVLSYGFQGEGKKGDLKKDRQQHRGYFQGLRGNLQKEGKADKATYRAHEESGDLVYTAIYEDKMDELNEGGFHRPSPEEAAQIKTINVPNGIRTRVANVKGWCPRPG